MCQRRREHERQTKRRCVARAMTPTPRPRHEAESTPCDLHHAMWASAHTQFLRASATACAPGSSSRCEPGRRASPAGSGRHRPASRAGRQTARVSWLAGAMLRIDRGAGALPPAAAQPSSAARRRASRCVRLAWPLRAASVAHRAVDLGWSAPHGLLHTHHGRRTPSPSPPQWWRTGPPRPPTGTNVALGCELTPRPSRPRSLHRFLQTQSRRGFEPGTLSLCLPSSPLCGAGPLLARHARAEVSCQDHRRLAEARAHAGGGDAWAPGRRPRVHPSSRRSWLDGAGGAIVSP